VVKRKQLDPDQKKVFTLPEDKDYLVKGPPAAARRTALTASEATDWLWLSNVVVVVHTRNLQEFIRSGPSIRIPAQDRDFRRLATDILYRNGASISLPSNFDKSASARRCVADVDTEEGLKAEYSCVFVDEAQDFLPGEAEILRQLGDRFFGVADSRQKLQGSRSIAALEASLNVVSLKYHYRNGLKICKVADALANPHW